MISIDIPTIYSSTASFIRSTIENDKQRTFLLAALSSLQNETSREPYISFIHVPLLVHAAIHGETFSAHPLAVTTTLLFLGIDIIDDLADGDDREFWEGHSREEINLAAMTLLCSLPQLSIGGFDISPKRKNVLYRVIAKSFLLMAGGQQRDLASTKSSCITVDEVEKAVIGKSGEEMALFASLAAYYAGATECKAETYAEFGRHFGTAIQFATDCHDLFEAPLSRDLAHGARTLPIAFHLERKNREEREIFLRMLSDAENDTNRHDALRRRLKTAGDLHRAAFVIELYCQRALKALNKARPLEPANTLLQQFINHVSLFLKKEATHELRKCRKDRGSVDGRRGFSPESAKRSGRGDPPVQDHSYQGRDDNAQNRRLEIV